MRGLAIAVLFLGLCVLDAGSDVDSRTFLIIWRALIFAVAGVVIFAGV